MGIISFLKRFKDVHCCNTNTLRHSILSMLHQLVDNGTPLLVTTMYNDTTGEAVHYAVNFQTKPFLPYIFYGILQLQALKLYKIAQLFLDNQRLVINELLLQSHRGRSQQQLYQPLSLCD